MRGAPGAPGAVHRPTGRMPRRTHPRTVSTVTPNRTAIPATVIHSAPFLSIVTTARITAAASRPQLIADGLDYRGLVTLPRVLGHLRARRGYRRSFVPLRDVPRRRSRPRSAAG